MRIKPNHKTHHRFHVSDLTHRWWTLLFPEIQTLVGNLVKQQIRLGELLFFFQPHWTGMSPDSHWPKGAPQTKILYNPPTKYHVICFLNICSENTKQIWLAK